MAGRTFAIGDVHGEIGQLEALVASFPALDKDDTIVFVGDYVDRGPSSMQVVNFVRFGIRQRVDAKIVALCGNHEAAWIRVAERGWRDYVGHRSNGCLETLRSYHGKPQADDDPSEEEINTLHSGAFLPRDVLEWFDSLPYWHEDEHAIYVHAGVPRIHGDWPHPSEVPDPQVLLWIRTMDFFKNYSGKRMIVGHTSTSYLPPELSMYTPDNPTDLWAGDSVIAIDTGCGKGGFLSAIELPTKRVYETRRR